MVPDSILRQVRWARQLRRVDPPLSRAAGGLAHRPGQLACRGLHPAAAPEQRGIRSPDPDASGCRRQEAVTEHQREDALQVCACDPGARVGDT